MGGPSLVGAAEPRSRLDQMGQLLYVVEGEGWVQARGEQAISFGPGHSVSIAPGGVH